MNFHPVLLSSKVTVVYFLEAVFNIIICTSSSCITCNDKKQISHSTAPERKIISYYLLKMQKKPPRHNSPLKASSNMGKPDNDLPLESPPPYDVYQQTKMTPNSPSEATNYLLKWLPHLPK